MSDALLVAYEAVRFPLTWLLEYPVLTASLAGFVLIAWNRLGGGLGLNDVFWNADRRVQFLIGLGTGAACGHILHVRYLVHGVAAPDGWAGWWGRHLPSLLWWSGSPALVTLGKYMTGVYLPLLAALAVPAAKDIRRRWPLPAGLAGSAVLFAALTYAAEQCPVLEWANGVTGRAAESFRADEPAPPPADTAAAAAAAVRQEVYDTDRRRPYSLLLALTVVFVVACLVLVAWEWLPRVGTPPPVLPLVALLGLFDTVYGLVATFAPGVQYVVWVLVGLVGWACNRDPFKLRLPKLDAKWYRQPSDLNAALPKVRIAAGTPAATGAVTAADVLSAAERRWPAALASGPKRITTRPPDKPPLVVLAVSGGGSRSGVWTCAVLEELRRRAPLLAANVRLVTGASGGMFGAAYYAAHAAGNSRRLPAGIKPVLKGCEFDGKPVNLYAPLARALSRDALSPVVPSMLLRDLPSIFWPGVVSRDRGTALEVAWKRNTMPKGGTFEDSPFACPLGTLAAAERRADIPSLVFSPMLVEDARRLLISNLDLSRLCEVTLPAGGQLSCPAVEFVKLFPGAAATFEVGTAARLQASFPFVSPAVTLPTTPMRRVVDAGYYDNYGVDLATEWLYHHAADVARHSSGVLLLEVRGYANDDERKRAVGGADDGSLAWLRSPLTAVLAMRERSPWYRNDERLRGLAGLFAAASEQSDFLQVRAVEFPGTERSAPLGWSMTDDQRTELIVRAQEQVHALLAGLRADTYPWLTVEDAKTPPPHDEEKPA